MFWRKQNGTMQTSNTVKSCNMNPYMYADIRVRVRVLMPSIFCPFERSHTCIYIQSFI